MTKRLSTEAKPGLQDMDTCAHSMNKCSGTHTEPLRTVICNLSPADRELFTKWLVPTWGAPVEGYRHLKLVENIDKRREVQPILCRYLQEAHEDARRFFSETHPAPLDPRLGATVRLAHRSYPALVERLTLAGFFGEVVASAIAQVYAPHDKEWKLPALCFRAHEHLFRELIKAAQESRPSGRAVGRLGDDCIAFALDHEGRALTAVLLCEAKCSYTHRSASVTDGHKSLSKTSGLQMELFKIIQILRDRRPDGGIEWIRAIEHFRDSRKSINEDKYDLLTYAFGSSTSGTRLPVDKKHPAHTSNCSLVAAEINFVDLETFVKDLYQEAFPDAIA